MLDQCIDPGVHSHLPEHGETSFADPTATERVIFLPGGKAMVVDWNIESFVKGIVSFTIAGVVLVGAGIYGIMWADQRIKSKQKRGIVARRPEARDDSDEESSVGGDESD